MQSKNAERVPQNDRKTPLLDSQYKELVKIGDEIDLFNTGTNLPVPYVHKTLPSKVDKRTRQRILKDWQYADYTPRVDTDNLMTAMGLIGTIVFRLLKTLVPVALAGGGLYVLGLGIYMIVTWAYFIHTFIGILVLIFLALTIPQTISNSRRTRTSTGTDVPGGINIINNVKTDGKGGIINIINNVNQD